MTTVDQVQNLFKSIKAGNGSKLLSLIQDGCDPDSCRRGTSALIYAISEGTERCVEILINNFATLDKRDGKGKTASMFASIYGKSNNLALLFKAGADLNLTSKEGMTASMYAARHDKLECLSFIVGLDDIDLDKKDPQGDTTLIHAVKSGSQRCVEYLVSKGADINTLNNHNHCPLYIAIYHDYRAMADFLIDRGASVNIQETFEDSPISAAFNFIGHSTADSRFQLIEKLLVKGAKPTPFLCRSSFHKVIVKENLEIIRLMVRNGFRPVLAECTSGMFQFNIRKPLSPLGVALLSDSTVHIAKYLIANTFLTAYDVNDLPHDKDIHSYLINKGYIKCLDLMKSIFSSPLHLVTLSLIKVSDNITRYEHVLSQMPDSIQKIIRNQTNRALLCPNTWGNLQLDFSSQHHNIAHHRVLLKTWPIREPFTQCNCILCSKSLGYKPIIRNANLERNISRISL